MIHTLEGDDREVVQHFTARAAHYDRSSRWCTDPAMVEQFLEWIRPGQDDLVLDVACGTGLWAKIFQGKVARVIGSDFTPAMYRQASPHLDHMVDCPGEDLPFQDGVFDLVTVRQGIQFMDAKASVAEMVRVTREGGRVVLVQLCAYGPEDRDEFFEILRLRNPARRNFFMRDDLPALLLECGCREVDICEWISEEDADAWADNKAIGEERREGIRQVYANASPGFRARHGGELDQGGHYSDRMLFCIAIGTR